jgi:hypothetical protein
VIRATILREYVTDRAKAHRLNAHSRCYIQTKTGKLVSCFAPGHEPGARRMRRQIENEKRNIRHNLAMSCALMAIAHAVHELRDEGLIGDALVPRILSEAKNIMDDERKMP